MLHQKTEAEFQHKIRERIFTEDSQDLSKNQESLQNDEEQALL